MPDKKQFNPITAARTVEAAYRDYLATTIHFEDNELQEQLRAILGTKNFLSKGPFLEATPPYCKGATLRDLVEKGLLNEKMLKLGGFDPDRQLYTHQVTAIKKARAKENYIVVTGTGSGKTECFLLPIVNDILEEFDAGGHKPGVRAMILYPMNALANDQLKRLRTLLKGTDITFGRYTGDTLEKQGDAAQAWAEENPGETRLKNEIISREQIRQTPPNILLTNYSMLEYLLLRPQDAPLFEGAFGTSWRHIAIDEAHIYSGALGTEIAYLLRRLKARIKCETGIAPHLQCYATSATIGSPADMPKVAKFAQDIFGETFDQGKGAPAVIQSIQNSPTLDLRDDAWGELPRQAWLELRKHLAEEESGHSATKVIAEYIPDNELERLNAANDPMLGIGRVLLGEASTAKLVRKVSGGLIDLTDIESIRELGIDFLSADDAGVEALSAMVEVLSSVQRTKDVPILTSRYHSFVRAPEGLYINLYENKLIAEKTIGERYSKDGDVPVYEVSVCRRCGQAYILGSETGDKTLVWLNPQHAGTNADDDFLPRDYYRIAKNGVEDVSEDSEDTGIDGVIEWLCPVCGTLHDTKDGGPHRFTHQEVTRIPLEHGIATEENSRCTHCGYTNRYAIQPMRVSPEAAGSIICYELARLLPPFEQQRGNEDDLFAEFEEGSSKRPGSIICFSDKRQDAAFFAPAMERTYERITVRQIIREAVEELDQAERKCAPSDIARWISGEGMRRHPIPSESANSDLAKANLAWAWIIDELEAEDGRNSLEGLGVLRVEPTLVLKYLTGEFSKAVEKTISKFPRKISEWMTNGDYIKLLRICLDTLRERGGVTVPRGADEYRASRTRSRKIVSGDDSEANPSKNILFVGATNRTENKRSKLVRRYAGRVRGIDLTREDARVILVNLYSFLVQLLKAIEKKEHCRLIDGNENGFTLSPDVWSLIPHCGNDKVFICNTCGCEYHYDTGGICLGNNCGGTLQASTFDGALSKDEYYKDIFRETALPLRIEEHTAQLSIDEARSIQEAFINGDVHVLSCTTTFELGVDVGDLRAIFMRNVPPKTANYTQRAGRTGRRAGMPGYAITFARLRPHDIAFYKEPEKMIKGQTKPPLCYLDNDIIALRHIFAIALSQYFRDRFNENCLDLTRRFNDFVVLENAQPDGLADLRGYLGAEPRKVKEQLDDVLADSPNVACNIGLSGWGWVEDLLDEQNGRLAKAHMIKHTDFVRLTNGIDEYRDLNLGYAQALERSRESLKKEGTINVLAENGVLPKYGFPTDLVELQLNDQKNSSRANALELQRGLRLAVREYAPGAEVVAGKKLWKSTGIRKMRGREFEIRSYGKCSECDNFVWAMEAGDVEERCPVCGAPIAFRQRMLVPSYGFTGDCVSKGVGTKRPRTNGGMRIYFSQRWPEEYSEAKANFSGGSVCAKFASNAQLCVINAGPAGGGFNVCMSCGAASTDRVSHAPYCRGKKATHFTSLGTSFISDVLELSFDLRAVTFEEDDWRSLLWAVYSAATEILEITEGELGGTLYFSPGGNASIMLYDDVPGGAGHALRLSEQVPALLEKAHEVVSTCTCDEKTCCYGCLCNYYNQSEQHRLSRGGAMRILDALL